MFGKVREIVRSQHGYSIVIAGTIIAFFDSIEDAKLAGKLISECFELVVDQCGNQITITT
jgi:hypothetical protein